MFNQLNNIVILTGAGISAESGIKTFRDQDGLWEEHDVLEVATPEGFKNNPELVYQFYRQRYQDLMRKEVAPNLAHKALARLEQEFNGPVLIVTQNVDNLHERAGSKNIIHMHGELLKMRCTKTQIIYPMDSALNSNTLCQCCHQAGLLRPHIVWFGEIPLEMEKIEAALAQCDLFIAIGTSGEVYPAALFVQIAKMNNQAHSIEVNLDPTQNSREFDRHLYGKASEVVPELVQQILKD